MVRIIFLAGLLALSAAAELAETVKPVDWSRFGKIEEPGDVLKLGAAINANAARYAHQWAAQQFESSESNDRFLVLNINNEHKIRPGTSAALGLAVVIRTQVDEDLIGVSHEELTETAVKLIKGSAAVHKANGGKWGDHWQSTLWAAQMGRAAWMLWGELDDETREWVCRAVVHEADRHIRPGYKIKYWNGEGGNSRAEENSWDCMVIQQAVAMMPDHPHARQWKEICSKLMVSAYSVEADMQNTDLLLDGKSPNEWLDGYNVREDGIVINHKRIHNDYMCSIAHLQMSATMVFSMANVPAPESYDFNFDLIYRTLVTKTFESPPWKAPGGTMYVPGRPEQYYPQGTDWSPLRFASFYGMDALADVLGHDKGLPHTAARWRKLRGEKILEMQSRHPSGKMYKPGEYDRYAGVEQMVFWMMSDAHLLHWLSACGGSFEKNNWLAK